MFLFLLGIYVLGELKKPRNNSVCNTCCISFTCCCAGTCIVKL